MKIDKITIDNFQESFNLLDILTDSVFYPASGIDAIDIEQFSLECFSKNFLSFIHVDYSVQEQNVRLGMTQHFNNVGYSLMGIRPIQHDEIFPRDFYPLNLPFNPNEIERIAEGRGQNIVPFFAFWAVYELFPQTNRPIRDRLPRFSLLHIGGEACNIFEALYLYNKINPGAVTCVYPGTGYGDNWTNFLNPDFKLYKMLQLNANKNCTTMPKFLLANLSNDHWPDFKLYYSFQHPINIKHKITMYKRRVKWHEFIYSILKKIKYNIFRL